MSANDPNDPDSTESKKALADQIHNSLGNANQEIMKLVRDDMFVRFRSGAREGGDGNKDHESYFTWVNRAYKKAKADFTSSYADGNGPAEENPDKLEFWISGTVKTEQVVLGSDASRTNTYSYSQLFKDFMDTNYCDENFDFLYKYAQVCQLKGAVDDTYTNYLNDATNRDPADRALIYYLEDYNDIMKDFIDNGKLNLSYANARPLSVLYEAVQDALPPQFDKHPMPLSDELKEMGVEDPMPTLDDLDFGDNPKFSRGKPKPPALPLSMEIGGAPDPDDDKIEIEKPPRKYPSGDHYFSGGGKEGKDKDDDDDDDDEDDEHAEEHDAAEDGAFE